MLRRLYDWVLGWADTPYGTPMLFGVAFAESSFFPIPPDPLLMALAIGKPKRSLFYAFVCIAGSVLGGILGYYIGLGLWDLVSDFFFAYVPGFTHTNFALVQGKYSDNAFLSVFTAAFTPIPYKVFTIAGGVFRIQLATLVVASILGRGMRFVGVSLLVFYFGEPIRGFIDRYFNLLTIVFTVLLVLGFVVIKMLA
ncbi:MAG: DedA family protein [Deltaproteobacteria bacterium]|nr:MAG: DedA family protein [Deltaproteobacteria bacterium]